jgi:hypothetical protein
VMLDGEANSRQAEAFARVQRKAAAAAAQRAAAGTQGDDADDEEQVAALAREALLTCFYDTPLGQTVIDGAPAGLNVRCTVRACARAARCEHLCVRLPLPQLRSFACQCSCINDCRMAPGSQPRAANVAMLPVTCPGCDACPDITHQHMVLITVREIDAGSEARGRQRVRRRPRRLMLTRPLLPPGLCGRSCCLATADATGASTRAC